MGKDTQEETQVQKPEHSPGTIAAALVTMPGDVRKDSHVDLGKNRGYNYASADEIYGAVRDSLTQQGLAVWQTEKSWEMNGSRLFVTYELAITPNGAKPADGEAELFSIVVDATQPQAFGTARTYALKYWIRGKFLLATGEDEDEASLKPFEEEAGGTDKDYTGKWTLNDETMELTPSGKWPSKDDSMRDLMRVIQPRMSEDADPSKALDIIDRNEKYIADLPEPARKTLEAKYDVARKKVEDKNKKILEKHEEGKGTQAQQTPPKDDKPKGTQNKTQMVKPYWKLNPDTFCYESVGKWPSKVKAHKALHDLLQNDFKEGADKQRALNIYFANEENIKTLPDGWQDVLHGLVDALEKDPDSSGDPELDKATENLGQDGDVF